jgi:ABC-2 type transport system permease protein
MMSRVSTQGRCCRGARELFGNTNPAVPGPDALPLRHPVLASLVWVAVIMAIFVPLSIRRYRKALSR